MKEGEEQGSKTGMEGMDGRKEARNRKKKEEMR